MNPTLPPRSPPGFCVVGGLRHAPSIMLRRLRRGEDGSDWKGSASLISWKRRWRGGAGGGGDGGGEAQLDRRWVE